MYVVGYHHKKGLKIKAGDMRFPGDPVPEAEEWKAQILKAHRNLGMIQTAEEYAMAKAEHEGVKPVAKAAVPSKPIDQLSASELKKLAKQHGLPTNGSKEVLIARLQEVGATQGAA